MKKDFSSIFLVIRKFMVDANEPRKEYEVTYLESKRILALKVKGHKL